MKQNAQVTSRLVAGCSMLRGKGTKRQKNTEKKLQLNEPRMSPRLVALGVYQWQGLRSEISDAQRSTASPVKKWGREKNGQLKKT